MLYFVGQNPGEIRTFNASGQPVVVVDIVAGSTAAMGFGGGLFGQAFAYAVENNAYQIVLLDGLSYDTLASGPGELRGIFDLGGIIYFAVQDDATNRSLWKVENGVAVDLGAITSDGVTQINEIARVGDAVVYARSNPNGRVGFIKIGSAAPQEITLAGDATFGDQTRGLQAFGNYIYFSTESEDYGRELFRINATGQTELVADLWSGGDSNPQTHATQTTVWNGALHFFANIGAGATQKALFRIEADGSVDPVSQGVTSFITGNLQAGEELGGSYWFRGTDAGGASALWRLTGAGALQKIAGIAPDQASNVVEVNGALYLAATSAANGMELWRVSSSGQATRVSDINPGGASSDPRPGIAFNGALYFTAIDSGGIRQLWSVTGTSAPRKVAGMEDVTIANGAAFAVEGGKLYIAGSDEDHGREVWQIAATGAVSVIESVPGPGHGRSITFGFSQGQATAPTALSLGGASVREFAAVGAVVGTLSTTDPEGGPHTYTLLDNAGGRFTIVGSQLRVANGLLLDYEQAKTHSVSIQTTDLTGKTLIRNFTISLTNITPENVNGSSAANIFVGGTGNDTLRGFGGVDTLKGGLGRDLLDGGMQNDTLDGGSGDDALIGGTGVDTLTGGANKDIFLFNTAITAANRDTIKDFKVVDDTIRLENTFFKKLTKIGTLNKEFFKLSTETKDANDYIQYNKATGALFYDSNGSGAGGAVQIATLTIKAALTHLDFYVV